MFYRPGLREGMGPGAGADGDRRPARLVVLRDTTPLTETARTRRPARRGRRRADGDRRWCSTASRRRTACAGRPGTTPPRSTYGGYCFFNNAAIAADHVAVDDRRARVAVLDVDYHHGNGTQQIFYDARRRAVRVAARRPRRAPIRTSPGSPTRRGAGRGAGRATSTSRCRRARDDDEYLAVLDRVARPRSTRFDPALVVVSLGVDTFVADPICDLGADDRRVRRAAAPPSARSAARRWCAGGRLRRRRARRERQAARLHRAWRRPAGRRCLDDGDRALRRTAPAWTGRCP